MKLVLCAVAFAACCAVPVVVAQTNLIPSATNPGDAKQVPGAKASSKVPASAVADTATTGATIDPAKSMDAVLTGIEKDVVALADAMPAEKYTFAPKNSDFAGGLTPKYDGVRTFGQEVAHLAAGNYVYLAMASNSKPAVDLKTVSEGVDKATAMASLKASFAALHQAVATLTPANAFQKAGRGPDDSMISVLAGGMAHERDHYGQLVEYARMNGVVPPASVGKAPANPAK